MRAIHINLSNFRRVEPLMTKYYGFNRFMLHHEVEALYKPHKYKLVISQMVKTYHHIKEKAL